MSQLALKTAVLLAASPCIALAAEAELADPARAVLSPDGAVLYVEQTLAVKDDAGAPTVSLLLPGNATDLQIMADGSQLARVTQKLVAGQAQGELSIQRAKLESERARLKGQIALWQARINRAEEKDPTKEDIPALYVSIEQAKGRIEAIEELLKTYPKTSAVRLLVKAALADRTRGAVKVRYSYRIPDSRWQPAYSIDCVPGRNGMGRITVRLEALVWQNSCFDWKNTEVQLVSKGAGAVRPGTVRSWIVGVERPQMRAEAAVRNAKVMMAAPMMDRAEEAMARSSGQPIVVASTAGGFASWTPSMKGLVQGESRILLSSRVWNDPLTWTVRPLNRDAQVYICAEHELDAKTAWPQASARLSVDGVAVGEDRFAPANGKVFLSFGNDPRVRLTARTEPRKSGTEGFIGKTRVWEWAWNYTVRNDRDEAVNVSVERPQPKSVHQDVTVEYSGTPNPETANNTLKWRMSVAAHSESTVRHAVKVTAPEKLEIVTPVSP